MGYYAQEHEGITPGPLGASSTSARRRARASSSCAGLLGMFGLRGELAFQDAGTLSGGEKTKLALAMLVAGRHNLLLLDEPDEQPRPAVAHRDRQRAARAGRARWCS